MVNRRDKRQLLKSIKRLRKKATRLGLQWVEHVPSDGNPPVMAELHLKSYEDVSR